MSLSLQALGGAALSRSGEALGGAVSQRHRIALLAYLAVRIKGASRETLIGMLWPDVDGARARHSLSEGLHVLRRTLGEGAIATAGDEVRLVPHSLRCDVTEFEEAIRAEELQRAVDLYGGDFLAGFVLPSAPEFEQWVYVERQRLARLYADALERLARLSAAAGDAHGCVDWWRRAAWHDPYCSRVALSFMEAMADVGNHAGAIQHAQIHAALLQDEIGTVPDPRILELEARLRVAPAPPPLSPPSRPPAASDPPAAPTGRATSGPGAEPPSPAAAVEPAKKTSPHRRRPLRIKMVAVATGLVAVFALAWRFIPDSEAAIGQGHSRTAVFPFVVDGPAEISYLGNGVATLLSSALERAGGRAVADVHLVFSHVSEERSLQPVHAHQLANRLDASYFILGRVVGAGSERVRIIANLYEAAGTVDPIAAAAVDGRVSQLFTLVDQLGAQLLVDSLYSFPLPRARIPTAAGGEVSLSNADR